MIHPDAKLAALLDAFRAGDCPAGILADYLEDGGDGRADKVRNLGRWMELVEPFDKECDDADEAFSCVVDYLHDNQQWMLLGGSRLPWKNFCRNEICELFPEYPYDGLSPLFDVDKKTLAQFAAELWPGQPLQETTLTVTLPAPPEDGS